MIIERRNHGRGRHSYKINGRRAPGVTTIISDTMPKPGLTRWASRTTAEAAVNRWDELAALPVTERLDELVGAADAERDAAAGRGTEVHRLAERLIVGEAVEVPDELVGHVESYGKFLDLFAVEPIAVELVVANIRPRYCGTADLVAHLMGDVWLVDIKTGRSLYRETAIQATAYRRAKFYTFVGDGEAFPLAGLGIARAGVVHVRSDGFDFRPLDTGEHVWRYFRRLAATWHDDEATLDELGGTRRTGELGRAWVGEAVEPLSLVAP